MELTIVLVFASIASGQAPVDQKTDRLFLFHNTQGVQGYQEIATVMRTVAGIRELSVNTTKGTLALHGTADQVALAAWLFNELDQPADERLSPTQTQDSRPHEFRVPGSDEQVQVFHLRHAATARGLEEIVTAIRKSAGIQRIYPCNGARSVALRGTAGQLAVAERLINETEKSK